MLRLSQQFFMLEVQLDTNRNVCFSLLYNLDYIFATVVLALMNYEAIEKQFLDHKITNNLLRDQARIIYRT